MEFDYLIGATIEINLDKTVFNKDGFVIARVYSPSALVKDLLNPIYKNISIKGKMATLRDGIDYEATIEKAEKNQYGVTLSVTSVHPKNISMDNMNTDEDMVTFIEVFIGGGTADKVGKVKGLCDMVKNGDVNSLTKIKGIGEKTAKKIIQTYKDEVVGSEFIIKFKKLGFTDNEISKLRNEFNDDLLLAHEQVTTNIFSLVFKGFQLGRMDKIFLENLKGSKKDRMRIKTYLWKGLKDAMYYRYKSYISLEDFYAIDIVQNIEANVGRELVDECIESLAVNKKVKIIDNMYITTREEYDIEKKLMNLLDEITTTITPKKIDIVDLDKDIEEQEDIMGFKLNEGQRKAVKDIILSTKPLCMLNGFAGTGKTTVTRVILNIYSKYGHDNFKLCALSGRASSVLGEASGYPELSSTIHRTLGINIMTGGWCHTYENKFTSGMDILLIDEISMVDYYLLYSILAPVNRGIKIIVLGDSGQLPSLNFGRPIETLKLFDIQFNELTQVMRQSEDAYILKVANDVRKGIIPFKNTKYTWMGADTEICIGDSYEYMINTFVEKFKDDKSTIVATTTKATTDKINFAIQEKLIKQGLLKKGRDYIQKPSSTKGKVYKMYIGDYIMVLKNNYHCTYCTDFMMEDFYEEDEEVSSESASIFNGEIYKVKDIIDKYTILTDGYVDILVETSDLDCQLAYCSNVHKLQGSGFNNVFVYTTDSYVDRKMIISREWLYTAYTRSKKMLSIHTNKYYNLMEGIERRAIDEKVTLIEYYKNK